MATVFEVYEDSFEEYQGESFTRTLGRTSGSVWGTDDRLVFEMVDVDGTVVDSGSLTRADDAMTMSFTITKTTTASIINKHLILVSLERADDATISDVIAKYAIYYVARKSR